MRWFQIWLLSWFSLHAEQTICLNMIVKNEAAVIRRCLDSVKDVIDYWVIVDTGSDDGTQEIIRAHLQDIPGKLYERPWKNWGVTRTEAFELAKGLGDYILFMDADDVLQFEGETRLPALVQDVYFMRRGIEGHSYLKQQLVRGNLPWRWVGVTHEYLACDRPYTGELLQDVRYLCISDGASSKDPKKFWKNVDLLLEGLKEEPDNTRYAFYLAESYFDAGERGKAIECYQKRIAMGGSVEEEIFWSKFRIAQGLEILGAADEIVVAAYRDAVHYRPHRVEPYYYLAALFNERRDYKSAYECLQAQANVVQPAGADYLFNADWIGAYGLLFQRSICSYYLGHYEESLRACDELLTKKLPEVFRTLTENNRTFPLEKLSH